MSQTLRQREDSRDLAEFGDAMLRWFVGTLVFGRKQKK